ncbi:hypothetical protein [endosymbiont DhMRE of Dentiscutata heterogama]|uniref:hypothetical protein n=1 Tax=endosymbiont DhMRE of Dentiscutata heterogama TaxID=1609546 RepID=UPI002AD58198|nr:hypothetical protein [endosymbiont DhMRE of Dentiscutata heterogama]
MTELLIIKTADAEKIKSLLTEKKLDYQVIYNEIIQDKELTQVESEKQLAKDYQDWANDPDEWKDARGE